MNRCFIAGLARAALILALLPTASRSAEEREEGSTEAALRERIRELEAQVAEHARQLAAIEERLAALPPGPPSPVPLAPIAAPPPEAAEGRPPSEPANPGYLLPSRSWAGGELNYGGRGISLETHGFVDLEYLDPQRDGSGGGVSTFDNHHANIFLDPTFRSDLRGHVEIELEHSGDEVEIDQAYLRWRLGTGLSFQFGRFYTPFGIERFVWYSPTSELVSRPEPFRSIVPNNFYAQGLMALGTLGKEKKLRFTYEAAVSDGLGDEALADRRGSRQTRDNNSSRAFSGRGGVVVWPWAEIGLSYHTQRYSTRDDLGLRFLGLDLSTRWRGFEVRAERVVARLDRQTDAGGPLPDLRQSGWYGQVSYTFQWERPFLPALSMVTRFDGVDLDEAVTAGDDQRYWSWGANARLYDHFRAKLEYRKAAEDGPEKKNDSFLGQLVFDF